MSGQGEDNVCTNRIPRNFEQLHRYRDHVNFKRKPKGCVSGAVAGFARSLSSMVCGGDVSRVLLLCCWKWRVSGDHGLVGCCSCAAMNNLVVCALKNLVLVCDYCKIDCFGGSCSSSSVCVGSRSHFPGRRGSMCANGFFKIFQTHAAVARAAAADASHSVEKFLGCVFETFWWMLAFVWYGVRSHMLWILLRISGKECLDVSRFVERTKGFNG